MNQFTTCYFSNHKVRVYSNFASLFIVMKYNSSVFFFLLKPYILSTKRVHRSEIFRLLSGWAKIDQIPSAKFLMKVEVNFSLNFASLFSVMRDNSSVLFYSKFFIWFGQREPIKVQNFRLSTAYVKFHQICPFDKLVESI